MRRLGFAVGLAAAVMLALGGAVHAANTLLSPPIFDWSQAGSNQTPAPVVQIGKDSSSGLPCIVGFAATCNVASQSVSGTVSLGAGQAGVGNVGGKTVSVCTGQNGVPAITVTASNSYGTNYVVGNNNGAGTALMFPNAFTSTGSGILQAVVVTMKDQETSGFTFIPFTANPSSTTWTDSAVAAINAADVTKVRTPISLASNIQLAATLFSVQYAYGLGLPMAPGATTLYGVLLANTALTNQFAGTGDVQVCIKLLDDE
jgi:hypothetical protein